MPMPRECPPKCDKPRIERTASVVYFCCTGHAWMCQSLGGSRVEFPPEGGAYCMPIGVPWEDIRREWRESL